MRPLDLGLLLVINLAWALNFVVDKLGLDAFPPLLFGAALTLLGVAIIVLRSVRRRASGRTL